MSKNIIIDKFSTIKSTYLHHLDLQSIFLFIYLIIVKICILVSYISDFVYLKYNIYGTYYF